MSVALGCCASWGTYPLPDAREVRDRLNTALIDTLVQRGRAKVCAVQESDLVKCDGTVGPTAERQRIQRRHALLGREYLSRELPAVLASVTYPLHFIDFETSRLSLPSQCEVKK